MFMILSCVLCFLGLYPLYEQFHSVTELRTALTTSARSRNCNKKAQIKIMLKKLNLKLKMKITAAKRPDPRVKIR